VTQSPYVPSSGGQDNDPQSGEWSTTGSSGYASTQPDFDPAAPYGQFDETVPATGATATDDLYGSTGGTSTTDAAKGEAADLKDTAKDRGQQVAGVAKEQASAVKDTAVGNAQQVAGVAAEQASAVRDTAVGSAQQVADVAKGEVAKVTSEASGQFKDLVHQGRNELSGQLNTQQARLATVVRSFADELGTMGSKSDGGPLADLAKQGSRRVGEVAHYIESNDPAEILESVRNLARRRPAAFLVGSALAGVLVGRLTRNVAAEAKDAKQAQAVQSSSTYATTPATGTGTGTYATAGYESGSYDAGTYTTGSYDQGYTTPATGTTTGSYDYVEPTTYADPSRGDSPR